jgi:hypothetical protein
VHYFYCAILHFLRCYLFFAHKFEAWPSHLT